MSLSLQNTVVRIILCIIFPPLAVIDKGCGIMLLVFFLCFLGWLPATIVALYLTMKDK